MPNYKVFKNGNSQEFKDVDICVGHIGELIIHEFVDSINASFDGGKVVGVVYVIIAPGSWDMIKRTDIVKSDNPMWDEAKQSWKVQEK